MTETGQKRIQSFAFIISIIIAISLSYVFVVNLAGSEQTYEIELDEKINPNSAPTASLVRLPGIGTSRAEAIAAYRKQSIKENEPVFRNSKDLQKVKGIGPKTTENVSQWLKFEQK